MVEQWLANIQSYLYIRRKSLLIYRIVLTLSDGNPTKYNPDFLVHDADIRNVVNQLTAAGAEAISVNGERLIAGSAIYVSGTNIIINGNFCTSPFVIKAIGNSERMIPALEAKGGLAEYFRNFQLVFTIQTSQRLTIPKYKGKVDFKIAKPVKN